MSTYTTFSEMLEVIEQYQHGLVDTATLILALQCREEQLEAVRLYNSLPIEVRYRISLRDFDASVLRAVQFKALYEQSSAPSTERSA